MLSAKTRVKMLRRDDFEALKYALLEIILEFNEKIDKINDKITDLDLKMQS